MKTKTTKTKTKNTMTPITMMTKTTTTQTMTTKYIVCKCVRIPFRALKQNQETGASTMWVQMAIIVFVQKCRNPVVIYYLIYVCCPPSARRLKISSPLRLKSGTTCNFALQKKCLQPTGLPACNLYHLRRQFASPGPQVIARQRKRVSQEGLLGAGLIESGTRYGGSP